MAIHSSYFYTIRQQLSRMMDDCVLCTVSAGNTTTATVATTDPPHYYSKANDYFNDDFEVYCYSGTNIGVSRVATDWDTTSKVLTVSPAAGASYGTTSLLELHRIFTTTELKDAVNQAIELFARKYLVDLDNDTTVVLVEGETNAGDTIYTYEYSLPTNILYIHRITTEERKSGKKLTGTVSGTFTLGETVTGGTSGATGILSYSGATYILVREVDGTFAVAETATGGTSGETCSTITAVEDEQVGGGRFLMEDVVDPRCYTFLKEYPPKIKFDERYFTFYGDLRVRIEGQASQDIISSNTDYIFLPSNELVPVAATFLPFSKIESQNLMSTFTNCMRIRDRVEARPSAISYPNARRVVE